MKVLNQLLKGFSLFITITMLFMGLGPHQASARGLWGDLAEFPIEKLEFKDAEIVDVVRIMSELSGINIVSTSKAGKEKVTIYLQNITIQEAIDTLSRITGLWYRFDRKTRTFRIMTADEYQKDIVVFREHITRVFTLRHENVSSAAQTIQNLFGDRVELSLNLEDEGFGRGGTGGTGGTGGNTGSGTSERGSSGVNRRSTRNSGSSSGNSGGGSGGTSGSRNIRTENFDLTVDKLALLSEGRRGGQFGGIPEQNLAYLTQTEIPIYITVNPMHNLLFVRTSDKEALVEIEHLIQETDRRPPQVLLEMKILELTVGNSFRSVFDFDFTSAGASIGPATSQARNPLRIGDINGPNVTLGAGNFPLEGGTFIFQALSDRIRLRLQLLEGENKVNVLATPMLLATNNSPARLFIGEERVLVNGVSSNTTTGSTGVAVTTISAETEIRDIGNSLSILPRINSDRTISLTIEQDTSSVLIGGATIPVAGATGNVQEFPIDTVSTANLEATVLAKDGLTVAVGGMIRESVSESVQKVPFLGDIPFIGTLFRREVRDRTKTELVLLITPHIFTSDEEAEAGSAKRLDALSNHPYFKTGEGKLDLSSENTKIDLSSQEGKTDEQIYINLIRFAALQMAGGDDVALPAGVEAADFPSRDFPNIMKGGQVLARPIAAWRRDGVYITTVHLNNLSTKTVILDPLALNGRWVAASFEQDQLPPKGKSNGHDIVYLISDRPFVHALSDTRKP